MDRKYRSRVYDILCEGYESFRIVHLGCIAIVTHYVYYCYYFRLASINLPKLLFSTCRCSKQWRSNRPFGHDSRWDFVHPNKIKFFDGFRWKTTRENWKINHLFNLFSSFNLSLRFTTYNNNVMIYVLSSEFSPT